MGRDPTQRHNPGNVLVLCWSEQPETSSFLSQSWAENMAGRHGLTRSALVSPERRGWR